MNGLARIGGAKVKKILNILIIVVALLNCLGCAKENGTEPSVLYLEQPTITTCSNNENLNLQIRFLCNDKNYKVSNYEVKASLEDISVEVLNINYIENDDESIVIVYILDLTMPAGETVFDLNFKIDDIEYDVKDITHINYDNNFSFGGVEYVFNSIYIREEGEVQEYINDIKFDNFDVTEAEFFILGEDIEYVNKVGRNQVSIISTNDKSAIVGYACISNGNTYCIGNSYHTEILELENFSTQAK